MPKNWPVNKMESSISIVKRHSETETIFNFEMLLLLTLFVEDETATAVTLSLVRTIERVSVLVPRDTGRRLGVGSAVDRDAMTGSYIDVMRSIFSYSELR